VVRAREIRTSLLGADARPTQEATAQLVALYGAWGKPEKVAAAKAVNAK
jgi:hypothetical protein